MIQFYIPNLSDCRRLPPEEAAHCLRVLRMKQGDEIAATDGRGFRYCCRILSIDRHGAELEILSREELPPHWGCRITLAVAPTKNIDRMEWLLEKCVEMGIDEFVPVICEHSERRIVKPERLAKIMVSAMKQSLKCTLPILRPAQPLSDFLKECPEAKRYIGYCSDRYVRWSFAGIYPPGSDVVILIGPEGDFSAEEVEMAVKAGFEPVTFGQSRLRTETAGMFAVAAVHALNQKEESAAVD